MKVAIVGSRNLKISNLGAYVPQETTEIVSGGARGIDTCAAQFAEENGLPITVFLPDYRRYGRGAPLKRNVEIVMYADFVLIFWNGASKGTRFVIEQCEKSGKAFRVVSL